jgi:hypothetical protein
VSKWSLVRLFDSETECNGDNLSFISSVSAEELG